MKNVMTVGTEVGKVEKQNRKPKRTKYITLKEQNEKPRRNKMGKGESYIPYDVSKFT